MEFDKKNLLKLGKLARISIKDDKLDSLGEDLNSILKFVDQLKEIKTDQVDPTSNSLEQKLLSREDIVKKMKSYGHGDLQSLSYLNFIKKKLHFSKA